MAQLKFVLQPRAKKDGTHPIRLRIMKSGKAAYLPVNKSISNPKIYWDDDKGSAKKAYPNSSVLNNTLNTKYLEVENRILSDIEKKDPTCTSQQIVDILTEKKNTLLLDRALAYINRFTKGSGTYDAFMSRYRSLEKFLGNKGIRLEDVNLSFLESYNEWCLKAGYASKTTHSNLAFLRAVVIRGVRDKLIQFTDNPFLNYKLKKPVSKGKVPLSHDEINMIRKMRLPVTIDTRMADTQKLFLFMFNCMGMRISDALQLRWSNLNGILLTYNMQKTGKMMLIELSPEAKKIIEYFRVKAKITMENPDPYIFPFMDNSAPLHPEASMRFKIKAATKTVNHFLGKIAKHLGIEKKISTHVARHSWTQAALDQETSDYFIGLGLGHSEKKTTAEYQNDGYNIPSMNKINQAITKQRKK